ncbi:sporulation lipoprotein, YhcN/YlaJ family [Lentibacillus persicus]|uniref:Sporulation lipoprotein, YhcN/YlaJ family n=1 Tax=Lentibacillus persicus TaxID=640948 RepID=A0A1I1WZ47_9BACI|nr:YhcN/YlaJ family sporulation lipoprotein [Lentibacillus persicus]SFE00416.1 sporulation lipoprotein, YhcN/YlaJ family [Lentibacillus persicus]
MKWKIYSFLLIALFLVLAACGTGNQDNNGGTEEGQNDNNVEQTRFDGDVNNDNMNNNGNQTRDTDNTGNNENQYELADKAAERISNDVEGIDNAYVIKTDNNAYVAAELDQNNNGNNNGANNNGNGNNGNNGNNNNGANINGMTNNNNNNNEGGEITDAVKEEISGIVRTVDPDVDNVYVSTNPDFVDLANNYADDAGSGEPVEGLFDQMGNMIERVFPQQGND